MFLGWFGWCLALLLYCLQLLPLLAIVPTSVQWVLSCLLVAFEDKELLAEQGDAAASGGDIHPRPSMTVGQNAGWTNPEKSWALFGTPEGSSGLTSKRHLK